MSLVGLSPEPRLVMWAPPDDLAPFVSGYSLYAVGDDEAEPHRGAFEPAWASLRIALSGGAAWRLKRARGDWFVPPRVSLFGPSSELVWSESGAGILLGAGIRPRGWLRLFREPARAWANRVGEPVFTAKPSAIAERFASLSSDEAVREAFDALFRELIGPKLAEDPAIARIETALVDPAITSASDLAEATGISLRSLQRLADRAFGFPPKVLLRRARFLRSLHALRSSNPRQGAKIIDANYTDYSHFIRDSHDFLGMSPQAFLEYDMPLMRRSLELRSKVIGTPAQALDPAPDTTG